MKKGTPSTSFKIELAIPRRNITPDLERYLADHLGKMVNVGLYFHKSPAALTTAVEGEEVSIPGGTIAAVYRVVEEFPEEDILAVAKRYYSWLEALVNEREARFGD